MISDWRHHLETFSAQTNFRDFWSVGRKIRPSMCRLGLRSIGDNLACTQAVTWMDLEILILSEVSQKETYKYHTTSLTCGILNMTQVNLSMKQKQPHRHRKQTCDCQGEDGDRGRMSLEFGVSRCKLIYMEWVTTRSYCIAQGTIVNTL